MRFLLAFALCFVSVFVNAQTAPPMVLGGPQGIDVTRILARNWMSIPVYSDTPAAPLTGSGWPGRGYIIQVAKTGDTSIWQYNGKKWAKIGGFAENNYTYLESGGNYNTFPTTNNVLVFPSVYYLLGTKYNSSLTLLNGFPKTANSNGRIDAIVLGTSGPLILQGAESAKPSSPPIPANRLKLGFIYYPPFDTLPKVTGSELTSVFRIPGRDSIYFTSGDTTIAVKDSIGIARTDTASMLTNYVNTASNGLTKTGKDIRFGGTLNQATRIALGGNAINIAGSADSTRFFGNGSVAIGYRPNQSPYFDDSTYRFAVNGTSRLNGVVTYKGDLVPQNTPNAYSLGMTQSNSFGALRAYKNNGATSIQQIEFGDNNTSLNTAGTLSSPSAANYGLRVYGTNSAVDSGGGSYTNFRISPTINYNTNFKKAIHMGFSYEPTVQSLNNTTHIAFRNTRGSNLFNVNSGNTLIGYDTTSSAYQVDTTYKLDVNGIARIKGNLHLQPSSPSNAAVIVNQNSGDGSLAWIGKETTLPSNLAARNVIISPCCGYNNITSGNNTLIGSRAGTSLTSGGSNTFIGYEAGGSITTGSNNTFIGTSLGSLSNTSSSIHLSIAGGTSALDTPLLGLTSRYAFIGGGDINTYTRDFYFGGAHRVQFPNDAHVNFYAPSGWPSKADTIGSNFTINAGRGTGAGIGGSVIFRTSSPTTSGTTLQTLTERARISPTGNLLVGRTVDSIYKLDVNGDSRVTGAIYQRMDVADSIAFPRSQSINLLVGTQQPQSRRGIFIGYGTFNNTNNISIGIGHGVNVGAGSGNVAIGYTSVASGGGLAIGSGGNSASATLGGIAIGQGASATQGTSLGAFSSSSNGGVAIYGTATGFNSVAVGGTSSTNAFSSVVIGDRGSANNGNSIAIGLLSTTTAVNQLVIGGNDVSNGYGINDVYIGSGVRNASKLAGKDVTYNGSGAGDSSNMAGGNIRIAGGKGTGTGTPGSVIFSTSSDTTSGTALQTLKERARITPIGNLLINRQSQSGFDTTYRLDVNGSMIARGDLSSVSYWVPNGYAIRGANAGGTFYIDGDSSLTGNIQYRASLHTFNGTINCSTINSSGNIKSSGNNNIIEVEGTVVPSLRITKKDSSTWFFENSRNISKMLEITNDISAQPAIAIADSRVVCIGTRTVDTSSVLNVTSTTKGFLQPRMTNTQRDAITTPATGLQLFSTTDSANYVYRGTGGGWQKIANEISGSATLDFPSTNNGNESDLTITVTGASEGDVVSLGIPNSVNLNHSCFTAWVSATNTVTVRFNNYGTGALNPVSATFKVKVFK